MSSAYRTARENLKAAELATFKSLDAAFPSEEFDAIHQASRRGMRLRSEAIDLARKVWAGSMQYEKAEEIIRSQFRDFPAQTVDGALAEAYQENR
ncbi:hypothetical protein HAHE_25980 [Haloferula helveola]|uniref:Uncharacterized protein n=2 Tax=Haloferula helveola TaxID=490095 RepID=A0ABN6H4U2_9BACT|nr:hypothetical protein HAHE_25980 [Haloferula helveola]